MNPIALTEFISGLYVLLSFISQFNRRDKSTSVKRLRILYVLTLVCLLSDAFSYVLNVPKVSYGVKYAVHLLSYSVTNIALIAFMYYCDAYIREKAPLHKLVFLIPILILFVNTCIESAWFIMGKICAYENDVFVEIGTAPTFIFVTDTILLFYAPIIAFIKREKLGMKAFFLLCSYVIPILISVAILVIFELDIIVVASAVSIGIVVTFLQKDRTQKQIAEIAAHDAQVENSNRMLALEDKFETLYDVEFETGHYEMYAKGQIMGAINKTLINENDFFSDTLKNLDPVVYEPDREGIRMIVNREYITKALNESNRVDWYYRIMVDGRPLWTRLHIIYKDAEKKNIIVGVFNAEEEVEAKEAERARMEAESSNKAKTEFLFNMSHDIRTPMNAIIGFTNMAVKHIDQRDRVMDCLEKAQQSGQLLLSLINNVLEMSRIEAGKATLEEQTGDVYLSFTTFKETMTELAESKGIRLTLEFGEIRDRYVYCDFNRCTRVFVNIISNGIKYTREGGYVKAFCEQIDSDRPGYGVYRYTFTDNGIGMSEEFQKHVFEQFSRERTSTVSNIQGTGLGLAVCKSFVELMDGTIECKSVQGEGTTFTVTIPFRLQEGSVYIDPRTGEIATGEAKEAEEYELSGKRVLLVEDNEMNREIAVDILEDESMIVEQAVNGKEAVDILREKGPKYFDFILMDIQMPVMNGYEATKAIRAMYPDEKIPIIALSANAFAEDKEASLKAGMDAHVAKPINVQELLSTIVKFI